MRCDIRVVGVGGAGGNAVRSLAVSSEAEGLRLIAANTDAAALSAHPTERRLLLGEQCCSGLGAGGRPKVGLGAAREASGAITEAVRGADLVFVAAGMGGGTGTGAAGYIAALAREAGAVVVAVVTTPFGFEGPRRARIAEMGVESVHAHADACVVIENERLLADQDCSLRDAFAHSDSVLCEAVTSIAQTIHRPGLINLDFADVRAILSEGGRALFGQGAAHGKGAGTLAVNRAFDCALLRYGDIADASGALLSFQVGRRVSLGTIEKAAAQVGEQLTDEAEIVFGVALDEAAAEDEIRLTLIVTGVQAPTWQEEERSRQPPSKPEPVETEAPFIARARRRNALVMLS